MARNNFDRSLSAVLKHEGGYVDHPRDPGGATNMGITHRTLAAWRKRPVTKQDVMNLTRGEAGAIYETQYWDAVKGDDLPAGLDYAMFDYAVNSGAGRAIRDLQAVLGVERDGSLGLRTMAAVQASDVRATINALMDRRLAFLKRLSTWDAFGRGWARRVSDVRRLALAMAGGRPVAAPDTQAAPGKASALDTSAMRTPEGRGGLAAGAGAAGQAITEAADKIAPLGEVGTAFRVLFAVLMLAGVGLTVWALWKRHRAGELA